ncbi:uncharacterized protein LOC126887620 isoform X1 [Diabrotica virgifera virgifera]|uniref:Uncharacterized protein LOC114335652 isoform X1 n=2 Tax=Diabrotica virgifera virgifera TaxID=50390 RepID=A0A6P7GA50_DIAVI|nr:uncharacterized protein LOC126887620 isoform X1 [Diabrotica virgifera virgifera]XP_050511172.1 uncharacterized protein LOC126887620 isoform X1 [Diabrotica virgifera virgifera]XP_050511173.1 uncharacterized protein LOC126887620 isoform X1 [Diabrotica virgifera virgifera]XP_050511174.1 uncharacterized protein LOC126887620 isoform X1 [Diabrotica virgifera virgifera]XP_050511175.1 uncharacterized protein LOC126887620 isoform X1 [Diabrotica virgifera virgifera]XP_050511176.1 uncharacterized prot
MSRYKSDPNISEYESPRCCTKVLHYTWKTITCLFSHVFLISMVVSYCVLGAFTFEALEVKNEREVKIGVPLIRQNVTRHLWNFTQEMKALDQTKFTIGATQYLKDFEKSLLDKMNKEGWNGEENLEKVQWTRTGALFYSIIVITTIGYGHISPKTSWGKVVTIFYAILGIPLMLLCLSNIGDVMASSFRFLYWRVCCYMCQKKPKRLKRGKSVRSESRGPRPRYGSFRDRRYTKTPRPFEKRFGELGGPHSHSDTELRYLDSVSPRNLTLPRTRTSRFQRNDDKERKVSRTSTVSSPNPQNHTPNTPRGYSLDRKRPTRDVVIEMDPMLLDNTPILFNKYVVGKDGGFTRMIPGKGITPRQMESEKRALSMPPGRRSRSMTRTRKYLEPPGGSSSDEEDLDSLKDGRTSPRSRPRKSTPLRRTGSPNRSGRSARSRSPMPPMNPSPRMMTPLGYGLRSPRYVDDDSDIDFYYSDDPYDVGKPRIRPVPIWLCVFLVVSYILAGAYLFMTWEGWEYLDSAYFCFITLTTIGFGDLVPAKEVSRDNDRAAISIALCSLYLLFGISLLAMSFNLVQEEVISNVKSVAKSLGIIKSDSDDEHEDD